MSKKITLCGSMQFSKQMIQLKQELKILGWVVFTPDFTEKSSTYNLLSEKEKIKMKKEFIDSHFDRIKNSDAILVVNYKKKNIPGYIGSNTLMEMAVAFMLKKKIFVLNSVDLQASTDEVDALTTLFLDGSLEKLK